MTDELIVKLTKDLKSASTKMTRNEARYLIGLYLTAQDNRKASDQKIGKMVERDKGEPHAVLSWASEHFYALERQILSALKCYSDSTHMGRWSMNVHGIGPVVASGLLAHVNLDKCPTVGHLWAFAGLDPSKQWKKGEKRPFNAALKQICYYAGESFVRQSANDECVYGKLWKERKAYETQKNESGGYSEQAKALAEKATSAYKQTEGYKENLQGRLGKGHIQRRSARYAVKQFLADWWSEAYRDHFKKEPPLPYPIAILGHAHLRVA